MKHFITTTLSLALTLALTLALPVSATELEGTLDNFTAQSTYTSGTFTDVADDNIFAENVATAYELGLMNGQSDTIFGINNSITRLETLILACRLHNTYYAIPDGIVVEDWSEAASIYCGYATEYGIYCDFSDWSVAATRSEFAAILSSALPDDALEAINTVEDNSIPDVSVSDTYGEAIYRLYRAGILTGNDTAGTFTGDTQITRGAASAIVTRMADTSLRNEITLTVQVELTSCQVCGSEVACTTYYVDGTEVTICSECYATLQAVAESYMPYLESMSAYYDTYALFDVNKDGIPELFSEQGCYLYSYSPLLGRVVWSYESFVIVSVYVSADNTDVMFYYPTYSGNDSYYEYYTMNENGVLEDRVVNGETSNPDTYYDDVEALMSSMTLLECDYTIDDVDSLFNDLLIAASLD